MIKNQQEIIGYINNLKGYQGYIQFSDRPIQDIFTTFADIHIEEKKGFIYEAYFFNGKKSIAIKQINDKWYIDETENFSLEDTQTFIGKKRLTIKMAQIWEKEQDPLCADMEVQKLKKVVFAGFETSKGDQS